MWNMKKIQMHSSNKSEHINLDTTSVKSNSNQKVSSMYNILQKTKK